jgi:hypothetical protein
LSPPPLLFRPSKYELQLWGFPQLQLSPPARAPSANCLPSFGATTEYDRSGQPMNTTTLGASTRHPHACGCQPGPSGRLHVRRQAVCPGWHDPSRVTATARRAHQPRAASRPPRRGNASRAIRRLPSALGPNAPDPRAPTARGCEQPSTAERSPKRSARRVAPPCWRSRAEAHGASLDSHHASTQSIERCGMCRHPPRHPHAEARRRNTKKRRR